MSFALNRAATRSAILAGALVLASSFAAAQGKAVAPRAKTADVAAPGAVNANAPLKWVREPIGKPGEGKFLRVVDARGMGEDYPAIFALDASSRAAIILLVRGDNREVIQDAKTSLAVLTILHRYDRVGLVLADGSADVAYIYSKGHKVGTLKNIIEGEDRTSAFDDSLKRVYERDVLPETTAQAAPEPATH